MENTPIDNQEEVVEKIEEETTIQEQEETTQEEAVTEEVDELTQLKHQISELEQQLKTQEDKYLRAYAEFENFKRRKNEEILTDRKYRAQAVITDLLPALDNLERALSHASESNNEEVQSLTKGVLMVQESILAALKNEGVEVIEALNATFDPTIHQAVMQENDETKESGSVIEEFQKGYKLKDRVLRPSMVKVNA